MPKGIYERKSRDLEKLSKIYKEIGLSNLGKKRSEETKKKMRLAHLNNFQDDEWVEKRASKMRGVPKSPETREKMRLAGLLRRKDK